MLTTIQISDHLRRKLKVLTAHRGISYSELLEDLIDVYESTIPFKSDEEFRNWFIQNLKQFNLNEIIEEKPPHYVITDKKGKQRELSYPFDEWIRYYKVHVLSVLGKRPREIPAIISEDLRHISEDSIRTVIAIDKKKAKKLIKNACSSNFPGNYSS